LEMIFILKYRFSCNLSQFSVIINVKENNIYYKLY
jgi:hypothetical protein